MASREDGVPPLNRPLSNNVGADCLEVMRIINHIDVSTFSSGRAPLSSDHPGAALIVIKSPLLILVSGEPETVAPSSSIPVRLDQSSAGDTVARGEPIRIGRVQPADLW